MKQTKKFPALNLVCVSYAQLEICVTSDFDNTTTL